MKRYSRKYCKRLLHTRAIVYLCYTYECASVGVSWQIEVCILSPIVDLHAWTQFLSYKNYPSFRPQWCCLQKTEHNTRAVCVCVCSVESRFHDRLTHKMKRFVAITVIACVRKTRGPFSMNTTRLGNFLIKYSRLWNMFEKFLFLKYQTSVLLSTALEPILLCANILLSCHRFCGLQHL